MRVLLGKFARGVGLVDKTLGNSANNLRHTRSVAYSAELVLLNKHQISSGGAYLDCYRSRDTTILSFGVRTLRT